MDLDQDLMHRISFPFSEDGKYGSYDALPTSSSVRDLTCLAIEDIFYLCNPSIKKFIKIPKLRSSAWPPIFIKGFGFIGTRNEYVVIHLIFDHVSRLVTGCGILCIPKPGGGNSRNHYLKSCKNAWRKIDSKCDCIIDNMRSEWGVLVDGVFYWRAFNWSMHTGNIISFDLEEEKFKIFPPPHNPRLKCLYVPLEFGRIGRKSMFCGSNITAFNVGSLDASEAE